jgi:hypothetical protein
MTPEQRQRHLQDLHDVRRRVYDAAVQRGVDAVRELLKDAEEREQSRTTFRTQRRPL